MNAISDNTYIKMFNNLYEFDEQCPICSENMVAMQDSHNKPLSKPVCKNCGFKVDNDTPNETSFTKDMYKKDNINYLMNTSVCSDIRVFKRSFNSYAVNTKQEAKALGVAKKVANDILNGTLVHSIFTGGTGTGKTHLAVSIIDYLHSKTLNRKYNIIFISFGELLAQCKNGFQDRDINKKINIDTMNNIKNADLVVIDDLGSEINSDSQNSKLNSELATRIFSDREDKNLIVTTNFSGSSLSKIYDKRVVSRISNHSQGYNFYFENIKDHRLAK